MDRVRKMLGCDSGEAMLYTGKGIYVGVLDSGVSAHPDLRGRIAAFKDFTMDKRKYYDDNGHGTHDNGLKNSVIGQRIYRKQNQLPINYTISVLIVLIQLERRTGDDFD